MGKFETWLEQRDPSFAEGWSDIPFRKKMIGAAGAGAMLGLGIGGIGNMLGVEDDPDMGGAATPVVRTDTDMMKIQLLKMGVTPAELKDLSPEQMKILLDIPSGMKSQFKNMGNPSQRGDVKSVHSPEEQDAYMKKYGEPMFVDPNTGRN